MRLIPDNTRADWWRSIPKYHKLAFFLRTEMRRQVIVYELTNSIMRFFRAHVYVISVMEGGSSVRWNLLVKIPILDIFEVSCILKTTKGEPSSILYYIYIPVDIPDFCPLQCPSQRVQLSWVSGQKMHCLALYPNVLWYVNQDQSIVLE